MELRNRAIIKKIAPYLFVFAFSIAVAGSNYLRQISAPTNAADESITVQLINTKSPLEAQQIWEWRASAYVDSYFKNPIQGQYAMYWCNNTEIKLDQSERTTCSPTSEGILFTDTIKEGTFTLSKRESVLSFTHPSVPCGRVETQLLRGGEVISRALKDTGVSCASYGIAGASLAREQDTPDFMKDVIISLSRIFLNNKSSNEDGGETPEPPRDPNAPTPYPTPRPGEVVYCEDYGNDILAWGKCITGNLQLGQNNLYSKMEKRIENGRGYRARMAPGLYEEEGPKDLYWCTFLIVDAFNLALDSASIGLPTIKDHQGVRNMMKFFDGNPDYVYIGYRPSADASVDELRKHLDNVQPGFAIFFTKDTSPISQHVGMVSNVNLDSHCNGSIGVINSNGRAPTFALTVKECRIHSYSADTPVVAFAGYGG